MTTNGSSRPLTDLQLEVLGLIHGYIKKHGYPPTIAEMAYSLGVTHNAISDRLNALRRKGCVHRPDKQTARSITITEKGMLEWQTATST